MMRTNYSYQVVKPYFDDRLLSWDLRFKDATTLEEIDELHAEALRTSIPLVKLDMSNADAGISRHADGTGYEITMQAPILEGDTDLLPPNSTRDNIITGDPEIFETAEVKKNDLGPNAEKRLALVASQTFRGWKAYLRTWEKGINADIERFNEKVHSDAETAASKHKEELTMLERVMSEVRGTASA